MAKEWIVLRCSGQSTLPLVRSLGRAGIEVWAPVEQVTKRVPRANVKRVVTTAILPSYVFANAIHTPEVIAIINSPARDHREFRLFKFNGGIPLLADEVLAPLRLLERKSKAKAEGPHLSPGDAVKLTDGGFAGMAGTIETTGQKFATVRLEGFALPLRIANYYLLPNESNTGILAAA